MRFFFTICLLSVLLSSTLLAQDSLLVAAFQKHSHAMTFENGNLAGEGFTFLQEEAGKSPFFLIGEDHGIAEIPLFTAALFKALKHVGYQYFATETGPFTAAFLQERASRANWLQDYSAFLQKYPWSIPFYSWQEETTIIDVVMEGQSGGDPLLWGLDQEFAASFRMHFADLKKQAETEESRKIAEKYYQLAMQSFTASFQERAPHKAFMAIVKPEDFTKLKKAFSGQPKNLELIREMEESIRIYQYWFVGEGYQSNYERAEMMKRHFLAYYQKAQEKTPQPRVLFKFGANHIYRGANGLNVFDIGNFVSELASQQGKTSFHLYVLGKKGTQNAYTPFSKSEADKKKSYDAANYLDKVDFSTVFQATGEEKWSVVDLRPLRKALFSRQIKNVHPGLEKVIWSYDAILVIPQVSASTLFD